jgi:hypothetical protein
VDKIPYVVVGLTWVTALVCGTYLIVHGHLWPGLAVAFLGMQVRTVQRG